MSGFPGAKIDGVLLSRLLAISGQTELTGKSYPLTTSSPLGLNKEIKNNNTVYNIGTDK